MAKDKADKKAKGDDKKKDKKKDKPVKSAAGSGTFVFNPSILGKTISTLRSIMGNSETLDVLFSGNKAYLHIATARGRVTLLDDKAISDGKGELKFQLPAKMWQYAVDKKSELKLSRGTGNDSSFIIMEGNNYRVKLHFSDPVVEFQKSELKAVNNGTTAEPVIDLVNNAGYALGFTNFVSGEGLPLLLRWSKGKVEAAKMSPWHGVAITGPVDEELAAGKLSVPDEILSQLTTMGGEIGMSGTGLAIQSEMGIAEFSQFDTTGVPVSIDAALSLAAEKYPGCFDLNGEDLATLIANAFNVSEADNHITIELEKDLARVQASGRHGNVDGAVEIANKKGTLPPRIHIAPTVAMQLTALMHEPIRIHCAKTMFKIEPLKKTEWSIVGYGVYFDLS